jgi:hypothetical protein
MGIDGVYRRSTGFVFDIFLGYPAADEKISNSSLIIKLKRGVIVHVGFTNQCIRSRI